MNKKCEMNRMINIRESEISWYWSEYGPLVDWKWTSSGPEVNDG